MPEVDNYFLTYVPDDSEDVKTFMKNSISFHKQFWFNTSKQVQIEGSRYIEALKEVARKTTDYFSIYYTNLSTQEFSEIVSAAKLCRYLYFYYDLIPLDCECDFGPDMEGCKIEYITFNYSGGIDFSIWSQNPDRFDNLVKGIAKCEPLSKSLKNLDVSNCDLTKEKAQESMNKYKLKEIQLLGV